MQIYTNLFGVSSQILQAGVNVSKKNFYHTRSGVFNARQGKATADYTAK
jgi:hypothetical protein